MRLYHLVFRRLDQTKRYNIRRNRKKIKHISIGLLTVLMLLLSGSGSGKNGLFMDEHSLAIAEEVVNETALALEEDAERIEGKVYTFGKNNAYEFSTGEESVSSSKTQTYGSLSIIGKELTVDSAMSKDGIIAYSVPDGSVSIQYTYSGAMLHEAGEDWYLVDDNTNSIDAFKLENNIQKGALVLQKSIDHMNWYNVSVQTNAFKNTPIQNGTLYETTDIEMINGCYYRLIVVYETARKVGTSKVALVIPKDEIEYKRTAEVYEFYVANKNKHIEPLNSSTKRYSLGDTVLVSDFASYSGTKEINKEDLHYGWSLGNFFVSGFTSRVVNKDEVVFLKNAGDVVTLWFNLSQNINALNNNADLTITSDENGHDQYFQTPTTKFGKGMLIIRYTDHENIKQDPVMYYDYLLANTMMGTNTRVQLFEEGDYEVALDYEVTKDQFIPQSHHYRIFFKFSVRNANCMVYPFDVVTGAELTNSSVTENGFRLDLAKSRYLNLYIKKEVWVEGADGLTEDTRFNSTAKDEDRYTEEGIYTITVKNQYTGKETTKKIYVGTNRILAACANTNYSIAEIQRMIEQGATIYEDGSITMPNTSQPVVTNEPTEAPLNEPVSLEKTENKEATVTINIKRSWIMIDIACAIVIVLVAAIVGFNKIHNGKREKK